MDAPLLHVLCDLCAALVVKSAFRSHSMLRPPLYLHSLYICIAYKQILNWAARASVLKVVINLDTSSFARE